MPPLTLIRGGGGVWELLEKGRYLRATDDANTVGKKVAAGLPNITGTFDTGSNGRAYMQGAFNVDGVTDNPQYASGLSFHHWHVNFNAARSNSIYGNSDTVTPKSIDAFIWKRVE